MELKWCYSLDGESYTGHFDTRDEALREANDPPVEDGYGRTVWIGRSRPNKPSDFIQVDRLVEYIFESMHEHAYERLGDFAEDWPPTTVDLEQAEKALGPVIERWFDDHVPCQLFEVVEPEEVHLTSSA